MVVTDKRGATPNYVVGSRNLMTHQSTGLTEKILEPGPHGTYIDEVKYAHIRLMNKVRNHKKIKEAERDAGGK